MAGQGDSMAEWLRRQTRNLLGLPAQVRILLLSLFAGKTDRNWEFSNDIWHYRTYIYSVIESIVEKRYI